MNRSIKTLLPLSLLLLGSLSVRSSAVTVVFGGSGVNSASGQTLKAEVDFTYSGGTSLIVDLLNTSTMGAKVPSDVLTSVFFDLSQPATLTPASAAMSSGSFLRNAPASYNLGKEWQYKSGLAGLGGSTMGIGSAGLGIFSQGNFATPGNNVGGMDYGIVHGIDVNANNPTKNGIFVDSGMRFTFTVPNTFDLNTIRNVQFQYGTALNEPRLVGTPPLPPTGGQTPEPGTMALFTGLVVTGIVARRRRKSGSNS